MAATSAQISDAVITHRVGLERYSSSVLKKIVKALDRSAVQIEAKILTGLHGAAGDGHVGAISPSAMRQLKETLAVVQGLNAEAHAAMKSELTGGLYDVAAHESQWAHKLYSQGINLGVNLTTPSAQMLRSAVESAPLRGALLKDWSKSLELKTYERLSQAITDGVVQGQGVSQIAKAVAEIHPMTARGAEGLVRTAVNHVSNRAHLMYLTENADVFDRYKWVSVLDGRTTPICRARSGKVYDTGKGPIPPAHWRCRSTIAPVIVGEDIDDANAYGKWLNGKTAAEQDEILGKAKGALYRKGGLPLDRFVKPDGSPLSLDELRERELVAWKKSGLPFTDADEARLAKLRERNRPKAKPAPPEFGETHPDELKRHKEHFSKAPAPIRDTIATTKPLAGVRDLDQGSHYKPSEQVVVMTAGYKPERYGPVWRHEYGHHVDMTRAPKGHETVGLAVADKVEADVDALLKIKRKRKPTPEALDERVRKALDTVYDAPDQDKALRELVDAAVKPRGLSADALFSLDRNRAEGKAGSIGLLRKAYLFEAGDDGGFLQRLYAEGTEAQRVSTLMLADMVGAATRNKVGFGHSVQYYAQWDRAFGSLSRYVNKGQATEVVANYTALVGGSSEMDAAATQIARVFLPETMEALDREFLRMSKEDR